MSSAFLTPKYVIIPVVQKKYIITMSEHENYLKYLAFKIIVYIYEGCL